MTNIKKIFIGTAQAQGFGLDEFVTKSRGLLKNPDNPFNVASANIANFIFYLAVIAAVIYALLAGLRILGAFGNEQQIATAKQVLLYLAIGLAIVAFALKLVELLIKFAGTGGL